MITGTGTGVGKTLVAGALALALRERGHGVMYFKPVESGVENDTDSDANRMAAAMGGWDHVRRMAALRLPLAPIAASAIEAADITIAALDRAFYQAAKDAADSMLLIEGAGGLAVPIGFVADSPGGFFTYADLAVRWNLPLLIVADAALGTLNHTLMTVAHARAAGLRVVGIVINNFPEMFEPNRAEANDNDFFPVSPNRLARTPLSADELHAALRRIPPAMQDNAAISNPAMLSFLTQERILGIVPRLPQQPFHSMAHKAATYLSHSVDMFIKNGPNAD